METCSRVCAEQKVIDGFKHTCKRHPQDHAAINPNVHVCVCGRSWVGGDE